MNANDFSREFVEQQQTERERHATSADSRPLASIRGSNLLLVPGVNNLGKFGRWAFAEFTSVFEIDADFAKLIQSVTANGLIAACGRNQNA